MLRINNVQNQSFLKRFDNYYNVSRREGAMMAVDFFCARNHLDWIQPMLRYKLFTWFFKWYGNSKLGVWLNAKNK